MSRARTEDTMQKRTTLIPISILALTLAACGGAGTGGGTPLDVGSTGAPGVDASMAGASPMASAPGDDAAASATPAASAGAGQPVADGTYTYQAGDAGMVSLTVAGSELSLGSVTPAEGWQHTEDVDDDGDDRDVEIDFTNGDAEIDFDAELEDQTLDVDIDLEGPAADGSYTYPVGDAGTVTVDVSGMDVTLAETSLADGWEVTERESGGEVELDIVNAASSTSIDLDADIDDGRMDVNIEIEVGRDFDALRHDDDDDGSDDRDGDGDDDDDDDGVDSTEGAEGVSAGG
ncbi:MAG: hypothetical protein WKF38_00745 [Candidatus Limnocylindrales bacterium]